jgi:hypothetical protein
MKPNVIFSVIGLYFNLFITKNGDNSSSNAVFLEKKCNILIIQVQNTFLWRNFVHTPFLLKPFFYFNHFSL